MITACLRGAREGEGSEPRSRSMDFVPRSAAPRRLLMALRWSDAASRPEQPDEEQS